MSHYPLQTPVVLIIFNRPDSTQKVFQAIRRAQPSRLFIIADGHRADRPAEEQQCAATRAIVNQVDWDCQVFTNYADRNMGVKYRVSSGLDWVFDQVEEVIILEDDCLPDPTFFRYCEELLQYYRHDPRVMTISGDNSPSGFKGQRLPEASYHFSIYARIWGWATWRRAWKLYDLEMKDWSQVQAEGWLNDILRDDRAVQAWKKILNSTAALTWDCQWIFSNWMNHGLSIIPRNNLISNIGFSATATNTTNLQDPRADVPTQAMSFPLQHPAFMIPDRAADAFTYQQVYDFSLMERGKRKLQNLLRF
jgi:hypothetical protein